MKSVLEIATTFVALSGVAEAWWRMQCTSRNSLLRIDPLVDPGIPAQHVHAIHGGNSKFTAPLFHFGRFGDRMNQ